MAEEVDNVTRVSGYMVVAEPEEGSTRVEVVGHTLKGVAHWIIENLDYYPSNDEMAEIEIIIIDRCAASIEIDTKSGIHTVTVIYSKGESS